jgi:hypothetical protein
MERRCGARDAPRQVEIEEEVLAEGFARAKLAGRDSLANGGQRGQGLFERNVARRALAQMRTSMKAERRRSRR